MGLLDLFLGVRGIICCSGDSIENMEQAIMNDAKSKNEDLVHTDPETDQDKK